jgi:hypothetical protein
LPTASAHCYNLRGVLAKGSEAGLASASVRPPRLLLAFFKKPRLLAPQLRPDRSKLHPGCDRFIPVDQSFDLGRFFRIRHLLAVIVISR